MQNVDQIKNSILNYESVSDLIFEFGSREFYEELVNSCSTDPTLQIVILKRGRV